MVNGDGLGDGLDVLGDLMPGDINKSLDSKDKPKEDNINSPKHYMQGGIQTISFMEAKMTSDEFKGYLKGNVIKYISRAPFKGQETEDLKKAQWYLNKLVEILK